MPLDRSTPITMPNVSSSRRCNPKTSLEEPEIIEPADSSTDAIVSAAPGRG